ncbi:hypothetical protein SAMN05216298_3568 [Glycomyces sambucus]|uniref:Ribbon-helix-helix protein, copG family n=1 Tax=Glycomyces sambucus TaxID=380244 RepID=A0A1G9JD84_9ACTN|nr:hypothetical protein [Glycomyces sambucus]SDL35262.1 hypothetical protein SAMN05216298_3568 [Glycomyces sambucus]
MGTLFIRTDAAMDQAIAALTAAGRTKTEAVRYALLETYRRRSLVELASADADRLLDDPEDRAEMLAIQRYMGVLGPEA